MATGRAGAASTLFEGFVDSGSAGFQSWSEAEENTRQERNEERECENPAVQMDIGSTRQVDGRGGEQRAQPQVSHQKANRAAGKRDEHTFGQQLLEQLPAGSAHGDANGDFAPAQSAARKKQISYVGAGNQKDKTDGAEQNQKVGTDFSANHFLVRPEADDQFFADFAWILSPEVLRDDVHLGLQLRRSDACFQARKHTDVRTAPSRLGYQSKRSPKIRRSAVGEICCGSH